jgi:hypothetical protein
MLRSGNIQQEQYETELENQSALILIYRLISIIDRFRIVRVLFYVFPFFHGRWVFNGVDCASTNLPNSVAMELGIMLYLCRFAKFGLNKSMYLWICLDSFRFSPFQKSRTRK